jgi:hypothetical protein
VQLETELIVVLVVAESICADYAVTDQKKMPFTA